MVVVWTATAEDHLKEIFDHHLRVAGRKTAMKIAVRIRESAEKLKRMPLVASVEQELADQPEGFRSLVIRPTYKAVYSIEDETVIIVAIRDCRRDPARNRKNVLK